MSDHRAAADQCDMSTAAPAQEMISEIARIAREFRSDFLSSVIEDVCMQGLS